MPSAFTVPRATSSTSPGESGRLAPRIADLIASRCRVVRSTAIGRSSGVCDCQDDNDNPFSILPPRRACARPSEPCRSDRMHQDRALRDDPVDSRHHAPLDKRCGIGNHGLRYDGRREVTAMNWYRRLLSMLVVSAPVLVHAQDPYPARRERLVHEIAREARATATDTGRAQFSDAVMQAIGRVPRHRFVPPGLLDAAYLDRPLPIGMGQTISQPFIVALMTDLLDPKPTARVLEV